MMHPRFIAGDSDVIVLSSNGIAFGLHRKNLETFAGAFPLDKVKRISRVATVVLEESSQVLEVVFEFLYPKRYPDLEDKDFTSLISIADAVEKYKVFAAMHTCAARLKSFVDRYPRQIFIHAIKYDSPESLVNGAASMLIFCDPLEVAEELPSHVVLPWLRYRDSANRVIFDSARKFMEKSWIHLDELMPCEIFTSCSPYLNISCRNGFTAWIAYLENLSTRSAFEEEIKEKAHFERIIRTNCDSKNEQCYWLTHLAELCDDGLESADTIKFIPDFFCASGEPEAKAQDGAETSQEYLDISDIFG